MTTPPRVLCCGARIWTDRATIYAWLSRFPKGTVVIHGDNGVLDPHTGRVVRGADKMCGEVAVELGFAFDAYPADWNLGKRAGPLRNRDMLARSHPTHGLAFTNLIRKPDGSYSGTGDMVCLLVDAGVRVTIVPPGVRP